jgi:hypothetical protein
LNTLEFAVIRRAFFPAGSYVPPDAPTAMLVPVVCLTHPISTALAERNPSEFEMLTVLPHTAGTSVASGAPVSTNSKAPDVDATGPLRIRSVSEVAK